jgi:hypothetical protein
MGERGGVKGPDGETPTTFQWSLPLCAASFAAYAVCFSLRAMFRVCHDFDSVFGFGFSFLCD